MNRERRKQIAAARVLIDKGKALLDEARDMLETVKDDEQAARENLPPSLEDSERAQAMDAAVSELESAISAGWGSLTFTRILLREKISAGVSTITAPAVTYSESG